MSYRFVKVTTYYRNFLNYYYEKYPSILNSSYDEQLNHMLAQGFGWADFFKNHFVQLGVEAHELIYNAELLQKQWAKENGFTLTGEELLIEQLKSLKPEVIFFQDSLVFSPSIYDRIRSEIPSVKKMIGWCCSPFTDLQLKNYHKFDFVCTCSPHFQNIFQREGIKAYELNHAFESALLPRIIEDNNYHETDLIFIGSFFIKKDFHDFRLKLIEELLQTNINISIFANVARETNTKLISRQAGFILSKGLYRLGLKSVVFKNEPLKKSFLLKEFPRKQAFSKLFLNKIDSTPLFAIEMMKAINKSKIGFNSHAEVAGEYAANMRMFEVTGAGSCLLTDSKKNITDFFEPDKEVVVYDSPEDCREKVLWLMNNPAQRDEIAKAGQKRTLRDHNFTKRTEKLNNIILKELQNK